MLFPTLQHLEVTCQSFPKSCFSLIASHAPCLKSIKVYDIPGLRQNDLVEWAGDLLNLETLIIYKAPELTREAVENILEHYPNLQRFGDFRSFDFRRPQDMKKLQQKIKDESWNLTCIESVSSNSEEKDFAKLLSLHWFYLTESKSSKEE